VVWAETGRLARLVSKHRLGIPVAALAPTEGVRRRLCLYYGVRPFRIERADSADALIRQADRIATGAGWANPGDRIVIGFGPQSLSGGETGSIIVHTVGS
ncbi:MAG: pyruvate kinase alpha/beta domain-containing protein, partial [Phycisphaerae bacterium]